MADQAHRDTDRAVAALERRVESTYLQAQKDLQAKMNNFVNAFGAKDAQKQRMLKDGTITQEEYERWLSGQVFQGKRWKAKVDQMADSACRYDQIAQGIINDSMDGVFTNNANWQSYRLEHGAGLDLGFEVYDESTVARLLRDEPQLLPKYKVSIPKDRRWNQKLITQHVTQGILQGEDLGSVAKRIAGVTDRNKNLSLTRARTAMTGAQNAGRQESLNRAQKMGLKVKKQWLATLDGHTRHQHAILDGQKVDMNKPFHYQGFRIMYPGDPHAHPSMVYNCRCTMIGDLEEYPKEAAMRYDNIDGKPVRSMTYVEWLDAKKKGIDISTPEKPRPAKKPTKKPTEKPAKKPAKKPISKPVKDVQQMIDSADSVRKIQNLMNRQDWFVNISWDENKVKRAPTKLEGCDLDSAKVIATACKKVFDRYPQFKGKFWSVGATTIYMEDNVYAYCDSWGGGVSVNPKYFGNYQYFVKSYESNVASGWHPKGTTAEAIIVHELGHAIDMCLTRGMDMSVVGGLDNPFSSTMRKKVMDACGMKLSDIGPNVSQYATTDAMEWFAECFAEYVTSSNPRKVASEFGRQLEEALKEVK